VNTSRTSEPNLRHTRHPLVRPPTVRYPAARSKHPPSVIKASSALHLALWATFPSSTTWSHLHHVHAVCAYARLLSCR
jgi:hypothetical protein